MIAGALTARWDYSWRDDQYAREFNTKGDFIEEEVEYIRVITPNTFEVWRKGSEDDDFVQVDLGNDVEGRHGQAPFPGGSASSSRVNSVNSRVRSSWCLPVAGPEKPAWILRTVPVRSTQIVVG